MTPRTSTSDRRLVGTLSGWFDRAGRPLPWRTEPRDPYRSLVAEFMLQQTQVARVLEKFGPFLDAFPTIDHLAAADEHDVLAAWSGLGYYRRARSLLACARVIVAEHGGRVPDDPAALARLPGIGRYTAGAIASIVFARPAPIVDGNVMRVLLRLDGRDDAPGAPDTVRRTWRRAASLVALAHAPGVFNEGLMELGAIVCTPRAPRCDRCPLGASCAARRTGRAETIPAPRARPHRSTLHAAAFVVTDARGRVLAHPRPADGMWGGLWQAPTLETDDRPPSPRRLRAFIGAPSGVRLKRIEAFTHLTTHRAVEFTVRSMPPVGAPYGRELRARYPGARFVEASEVPGLPLSNPQRRILGSAPAAPLLSSR